MSVEFLRDFSLGINYIEIMIELEIFWYFIVGAYRVKVEGIAIVDKFTIFGAFGFLLGAFSRVCYIAFDYYIPDNIYRYLAWIFLISCVIIIVISVFRGTPKLIFKDFRYKKGYFLTAALFVTLTILMRLFFYSIGFWIILVCTGAVILVPILYLFNQWIKCVGGYIKKYFTMGLLAIPLTFIGIGIGPLWGTLPEYEGWLVKISAHITFLVGLGLLAISLWTLPTLTEIGWEDKIYFLYVIMPGGILAYEYHFKKESKVDSDLLSSGITGIVDIVKEMTGSLKRLKIIRQEKKNIYLEYGTKVTVAIIAEEELKILFEKLARFTREFEAIFADVLESWDGNTDIFKIADSLTKRIFITTK